MEDIERIRERLENIKSVEPIITSLRTIAAGGWRLALRRRRATSEYLDNLRGVLAVLLPRVPRRWLMRAHVAMDRVIPQRPAMLVIASERGLCGAFNDIVLEGAERLIAQQQLRSEQVLVATLGSRAESFFRRRGRHLLLTQPLPVTRVATFEMVCDLARTLLHSLAGGEVDAIQVIHSPYKAATVLPPVAHQWLPIDASALPRESAGWPRPIIETDRDVLFERAIEEWTFAQLFRFVMESAASEQSARFRAMDAASSNLGRIVDELTLSYHTARQHAITMEMLDLVAGSGILRGPAGRET